MQVTRVQFFVFFSYADVFLQDAFTPSDFPQRVRDTVNQFDDNFAFDVRS